MGKFNGGQGKANRSKKKKKIHTAVKFDADDRNSYLNSYIGAKKRRKEHWEMRKQQQERQLKHQQRLEDRQVRMKEIEKMKELLQFEKQAQQPQPKEEVTQAYQNKKQRVQIKTTFM